MNSNLLKSPPVITLLLIIGIGIFFRLYNFSWGAPYFFHPDERNIASSISQLSYKENMNPHFFAYGTFPIYTTYFIGVSLNIIQNIQSQALTDISMVTFEESILIGRALSIFLSILTLILIYKIGARIFSEKAGFIAVVLSALSVGFIQYAHFSTFEMWLTFLTLLLCHLLIAYSKSPTLRHLAFSSVVFGLLLSTKVSSFPLVIPALVIISWSDLILIKKMQNKLSPSIHLILNCIFFISLAALILILTSPYIIIDKHSFLNSMNYESSVALGTLDVFYTQTFKDSLPVIYQALRVYPFTANPFLALAFIVAILFTLIRIRKEKNKTGILLILSLLGILYVSQIAFYVKWIRYYIPTLGFLYILNGYLISSLITKRTTSLLGKTTFIIMVCMSLLYSYSYFKTVLLPEDTRVVASRWAQEHINPEATILSEVYDLGIVPFNQYFPSIELFNFYEIDNNTAREAELQTSIDNAGFIILPSQRLIESRHHMPKNFPKSSEFYNKLTNGGLGFKKIYQTPCDLFCQLLYMGDPLNHYEQTANVFDRPTVQIYQKTLN